MVTSRSLSVHEDDNAENDGGPSLIKTPPSHGGQYRIGVPDPGPEAEVDVVDARARPRGRQDVASAQEGLPYALG